MGPLVQARIVPVPKGEMLEYTRDGVTYRPALAPTGQLVMTVGTAGDTTQIKILGTSGGRQYLNFAAPVRSR